MMKNEKLRYKMLKDWRIELYLSQAHRNLALPYSQKQNKKCLDKCFEVLFCYT